MSRDEYSDCDRIISNDIRMAIAMMAAYLHAHRPTDVEDAVKLAYAILAEVDRE